ncbi:hypothetical protein [Algivirga pacifica]|uniref:Uncharacterized protein n=1 Tax=Algivirga pacifica TaxID=1162670 RepID=A0ABP9D8V8_9BACT
MTSSSSIVHQKLLDGNLAEVIDIQYDLQLKEAKAGISLSLIRKDDPGVAKALLHKAIEMLCNSYSITNKPQTIEQYLDIIGMIQSRYYYMSIEEVLYCFKKVKQGAYGPIYNRIDIDTIAQWLERYDVEERTPDAVNKQVSRNNEEKKDESLDSVNMLKVYQQFKGGNSAYHAVEQQQKKEQQEQEAYRKYRQAYLAGKMGGR